MYLLVCPWANLSLDTLYKYVDFINCLAKFDVKAHLLIKVEKVSLAVIKID
jgi:hypothetical protein